jgi:hypothetical protein
VAELAGIGRRACNGKSRGREEGSECGFHICFAPLASCGGHEYEEPDLAMRMAQIELGVKVIWKTTAVKVPLSITVCRGSTSSHTILHHDASTRLNLHLTQSRICKNTQSPIGTSHDVGCLSRSSTFLCSCRSRSTLHRPGGNRLYPARCIGSARKRRSDRERRIISASERRDLEVPRMAACSSRGRVTTPLVLASSHSDARRERYNGCLEQIFGLQC